MKNFAALTRMRIQLTLRNKMFLFFSVIMPFGFFFLYSGVFAKGDPVVVRYFLGPVISLTVMGSFWGLSAALVIFREQGILRRFHVTPVTASDMLASSIVSNYILTLPTVACELLLARLLFHVHDFGNLLSVLILVTVGIVSFASLGLVVASVTNTMQETQVLNQLIWLPLIFLSGATMPLASLPRIVRRFSVFLPATYLVTGLQRAIFVSVPFWKLPIEIISLTFWAMLTFFISAQLFRWEPESKIPRKAKLWALATVVPFVILGFWENHHGRLHAQTQSTYDSLSAPSKTPPPRNATPEKPQ
ncbi:MAG TPA: ABC transporter permease [Candidatus Dormibacteraeota bacterium]|nr:ABC transporter permease [Candidatus Dormibacteraeota bacterium]